MTTSIIQADAAVAEYINGKYHDAAVGAVRFPAGHDIYIMLHDLMAKRPADRPIDRGNIRIALPSRREGKDPATYNWFSERSQRILNAKMRQMMWAELHDMMDENKHVHGLRFKDTVYMFMQLYGIESVSEDALIKNYQRWRDKMRRRARRSRRN